MPTLSIASAKGGCGKTTVAILLAAELALSHDYRVALLDSDVNQHASAFGKKSRGRSGHQPDADDNTTIKTGIAGLTIVSDIREDNLLAEVRKAENTNDFVIIDLPGGSTTLAFKAMQRSHFVLVPTQASLPDVRDAIKTISQIDDAQDLGKWNVARAIVWTRLLPGFESRGSKRVRTDLEGQGVDILKSALLERAAFREIHITGQVPRQEPSAASATHNIETVTNELLDRLEAVATSAQKARKKGLNDATKA
jgi:chromosome partitioning protein